MMDILRMVEVGVAGESKIHCSKKTRAHGTLSKNDIYRQGTENRGREEGKEG